MAMLPNDHHPGPRRSCRNCLDRDRSAIAATDTSVSVTLLLSVAVDLFDAAHALREYGDWGAVSLESQGRQVLAEALYRRQRGAL